MQWETSEMRIDQLSHDAQVGLRRWALWQHENQFLLDAAGCLPDAWAWICFQLQVAEDRPEWFPKGKFATIQTIEKWLYDEAVDCRDRRQRGRLRLGRPPHAERPGGGHRARFHAAVTLHCRLRGRRKGR